MEYKHFEVVCETKKSSFHGFRHSFNITDTATHVVFHSVFITDAEFLKLLTEQGMVFCG